MYMGFPAAVETSRSPTILGAGAEAGIPLGPAEIAE
jgi:hypothetical protein